VLAAFAISSLTLSYVTLWGIYGAEEREKN
jgi:hypothetical protein